MDIWTSEGIGDELALILKRRSHISDLSKTPTESLLPLQFFTQLRGGQLSGEQRLILAVLEDAVYQFNRGLNDRLGEENRGLRRKSKASRESREAEEWFKSEDVFYLFSFVNICAILGLDTNYLRSGLWQYKKRHLESALRETEKREVLPNLSKVQR